LRLTINDKRPIRAKHTPDKPTEGIVKEYSGNMLYNVSIGKDIAIANDISNDHKDRGYIKTTDNRHHIFIKACRNEA
jgi:hypothetical protein